MGIELRVEDFGLWVVSSEHWAAEPLLYHWEKGWELTPGLQREPEVWKKQVQVAEQLERFATEHAEVAEVVLQDAATGRFSR